MTEQEQNELIAELCGKKTRLCLCGCGVKVELLEDGVTTSIPYYVGSHGAMSRAEATFSTAVEKTAFIENLLFLVHPDPKRDGDWTEYWKVLQATPAQRAKAFIQTFGKWVD